MKILFLHGWHSVVGGVKPSFLASAGHDVCNPALHDDDFSIAMQVAQQSYNEQRPDVIVGSSRGGAIAMNLNSFDTPLVLLCPAWKRWGTAATTKRKTVILHSQMDDVIPFDDSRELLLKSGLGAEALIETGKDHRLADVQSLEVMLWVCELLGARKSLPAIDPDLDGRPHDPAVRNTQCEGGYVCDTCGEEIVIPLDITEGVSQIYVEDCPVCCNANRIHVFMSGDQIDVWAESEQDPSRE